ncbi:MAG: Protein of unknown function rane [Parcubacteria group bacterium]|nr:Protein of unknown function rane [Parcubacteria group bacterium]
MQTTILAALAFPVIFLLDLLWIGLLAHSFYREQMGNLLSPSVVWPAALAFYIIFCFALAYFAVAPALEARSLLKAMLLGGFLGLAVYASYDFTNWATLTNWPGIVSIVDLMWGVVVSALAAGGSYLLAIKFFAM